MERLIAAVTRCGMAVAARIDHAGAARAAGLELRPTEVLIFGNPKAGTPLMQSVQTMGIDLPLKALVFEDAGHSTWVAINDPQWLAARHAVTGMGNVLAAMAEKLAAAAREAVAE
jgi:uncharacterized protein (DUF302 family)